MSARLAATGLAAAALMWTAAPETAHALDPYMWGIGPRVGTLVIPGRYPLTFPKVIEDRVEDGTSTLERVRHDVFFGAEGVYYINSYGRMVADLGMGLGKRYLDLHIMVKYNYVAQAGAMDFLFGGGLGFGSQTFRGDDDERLNIPYYPFKAEVSALVRDGSRGYQGSVFGLYNLPANHFYRTADGEEEDVKQGFNGTIGIEIAILFGDFEPPKRRRRGGGN